MLNYLSINLNFPTAHFIFVFMLRQGELQNFATVPVSTTGNFKETEMFVGLFGAQSFGLYRV